MYGLKSELCNSRAHTTASMIKSFFFLVVCLFLVLFLCSSLSLGFLSKFIFIWWGGCQGGEQERGDRNKWDLTSKSLNKPTKTANKQNKPAWSMAVLFLRFEGLVTTNLILKSKV